MPRGFRIWNRMNVEVPGCKSLAHRQTAPRKPVFPEEHIFVVTYYIQWFFKNWFQVILESSGTRIHFVRLRNHSDSGIHRYASKPLSNCSFPVWRAGLEVPLPPCQWTMLGLERAMRDHIYCSIGSFFLNCPENLERKQASVLTEELSVNSHFSHGAN